VVASAQSTQRHALRDLLAPDEGIAAGDSPVREHAIKHFALAQYGAHRLAGECLRTGGKREQQQTGDGAANGAHRSILD